MAILHPMFYPNQTSHHCFFPDSAGVGATSATQGGGWPANWSPAKLIQGSWIPKDTPGKKNSGKNSTSSAQKRIEVHKAVTVAWCWRLGNIFQEAGISTTSLSRPVVLKTSHLQIQNFESCGYFFEVFGIWSCLVSESSTRSCEPRCLAAHEVMKFTHLKFHRLKFPTPTFHVKRNVWAAVSPSKISTWGSF